MKALATMRRGPYQIASRAASLLVGCGLLCAPLRQASAASTLVRATLVSSLETALVAQSAGEGRALAAEVARLWRRPSHAGDGLTVLFDAGAPAGEPLLQALTYTGRKAALEAYRFCGDDGLCRYYDGTGRRLEPVMRNPPVPRYEQITERVQRGRGGRRHAGDDLKAAVGDEVVLPFAGRVLRTNWHRRRNGLCVEVLLDAGYTARFLHLSKVADGVQRGAYLAAGTKLGEVGNTGRSTGPHLHYELLKDQRPIEPLSVHGRSEARLAGAELARFLLTRDAWRRQLTGPKG